MYQKKKKNDSIKVNFHIRVNYNYNNTLTDHVFMYTCLAAC